MATAPREQLSTGQCYRMQLTMYADGAVLLGNCNPRLCPFSLSCTITPHLAMPTSLSKGVQLGTFQTSAATVAVTTAGVPERFTSSGFDADEAVLSAMCEHSSRQG
jgi:hypothetical protein